MKQAKDYPVTFPYGATSYPYGPTGYAGPYHRGDDRVMPIGTAVLVNGAEVGLSGATGKVTGAHLHIGRFAGGEDTNPRGQGFTLTSPHVFDTGYDKIDGNYVRIMDSKNVIWVYLHLSKVLVKSGDKLIPKEDGMTDKEAHDVGTFVYRTTLHREPENSTRAVAMGKAFGTMNGTFNAASIVRGFQRVMVQPEWKGIHIRLAQSQANEQTVKDTLFNKIKGVFGK